MITVDLGAQWISLCCKVDLVLALYRFASKLRGDPSCIYIDRSRRLNERRPGTCAEQSRIKICLKDNLLPLS